MDFHLIVRHPFGEYSRGDRITDPEDVARLARDGGDHVARVAVPLTSPAPAEPQAG